MSHYIEFPISTSFLFAKLRVLWIENRWIYHPLQFIIEYIQTIRFYGIFNMTYEFEFVLNFVFFHDVKYSKKFMYEE